MRSTRNDGVIRTNEFLSILNTIENDIHPITVLSGARRCGKTTVLNEYSKIENNKGNLVLQVDIQKYYIGYLTDKERQTYIELILCKELLKNIKHTYIYQTKNVKKIVLQIEKKLVILHNYINTVPYNSYTIDEYLIKNKGSLLLQVVKEIKKSNINKVILGIDRFDWIGNSSKYYQSELLSYSNILDKIIVTSDDDKIYNYKSILLEKGINIIDVNYSKNINSTKDIIKHKLKVDKSNVIYLNEYKYVKSNIEKLFSDDIYKYFIKLCNGNFEYMFSILNIIKKTNKYLSIDEIIELIDIEVNKKNNIYSLIKKKTFHIDN